MRHFSRLRGTPFEVNQSAVQIVQTFYTNNASNKISTGLANFLSGGLASFVYWVMAIPADNVKKYARPP